MRAEFKKQIRKRGKISTRNQAAMARALKIVAGPLRSAGMASKPTLNGAINAAINRKAETKRVMYYSRNGAATTDPGSYANWQYRIQNQYISSNATDIMRLCPLVLPGTSDNQRIGNKISPVSLTVKGNISIPQQYLLAGTPWDVFAVIYVLQHVSLKSYSALQLENSFNQLLETGENTTVGFGGIALHASLPVSKQNYKVLAKKIVRLRFSGTLNATGTPATYSRANSHSYNVPFSISLTKHLPAKYVYPEADAPTPTLNDPVNSSPFMCVAYYNYDQSQPSPSTPGIAVQYHSELLFKDT